MSGKKSPRPPQKPAQAGKSTVRRADSRPGRALPLEVAQDELGLVTWIWDARRNRTTWYGDVSPLLGLAPKAFPGGFDDYLALVHPDDREATRARYRECVKGLRPAYRSEERVVWPDGSIHWLETYGRARYGRTGRALELYGVVHDCTDRKQREAALAESEERFQKAFDSSQEAIAITRVSDDRVVSVNRSMEALYGAPASVAIGRTTKELDFWADEGASYDAIVAVLRADRRVRNLEVAVRTRSGQRRTCIYSADVIEIRGEYHVIAFLRDVTDQRQAERLARQSLDRFTAVFANSPDSISISRLRDGQVLAVNDAWVRLNGYPRDEVLKLTAPRVGQWLPGDREAVMAELRQSGRVVNRLTTFRRRDGSLRQSLISVVLVNLDGEPCTVWMGRDVSDLQRAQHELAASERRYRSLFEAAMDCILVIAPDGTLVDINQTGCRALGYTPGELRGGSFTRILDESGLRRLLPRPAGIQAERRSVRAEQDLRAKDGSVRAVEFSAGPLPDGNIIVIVRDISERKRDEARRLAAEAEIRQLNLTLERRVEERTAALEAANRELESYSYTVSHDLRAPIRAILGFSEILRTRHAGGLSAESLRLFERIEGNAQRMGELIDDLLEFSRTGRVSLSSTRIEMRGMVEAVWRELGADRPTLPEIEVGAVHDARGDPSLVRQVWLNLLGNAIKFTRHATAPRVSVSSRCEGGMVEYAVGDNGAGFDMAYAGKLFGVFERLHSPSEFEGTGVGLAIVQRIVKRHGGEVGAEGAPGRGATFRFTLPADG